MNGRTEAQRLAWRRSPDSNDRSSRRRCCRFSVMQRTMDGGGEEERREEAKRSERERIPGNAALVQVPGGRMR